MTWEIFTEAIRSSKISTDIPWKIIDLLFSRAGCKKEISESAIKSWLSGKRNCKTSKYFPDNEINTQDVFRYFRNRPGDKLRRLQEIFRENPKLDRDSPIDLETNDLDVFCWSLVNQFLDLLLLPRIIQPEDASKTFCSISMKNSESTQEGPYSEVAGSINIQDAQRDTIDTSGIGKRIIEALSLPHRKKCCFYCKYWSGRKDTIGAYRETTYGRCLKYNREQQPSSVAACESYEADKVQLDWIEIFGGNTERFI